MIIDGIEKFNFIIDKRTSVASLNQKSWMFFFFDKIGKLPVVNGIDDVFFVKNNGLVALDKVKVASGWNFIKKIFTKLTKRFEKVDFKPVRSDGVADIVKIVVFEFGVLEKLLSIRI